MTSVATNAFAWALDYVAQWEPDDEERRIAFDVWPGDHVGPEADTAVAAIGGKIADAAQAMASGETTSVELTKAALDAAAKHSDRLVAFVELTAATALEAAAERDAERTNGVIRGPMHGIPISVKDVIHVGGVVTRCGSDAYEKVPHEDAWAVARMREAGAVILGKVSTHEYALGVTSPQAHNPHDESRIPGGSSGGSTVAVATGMGLGSICTDTRASSRVPAALSGTVGLKPTYGTIPTRGMVPLAWTMDHVGVIASTVGDAALMLDSLRDSQPVSIGLKDGVSGKRLGMPRAAFEQIDPAVAASVAAAIADLSAAGADLIDVDAPAESDFIGANAGGLITSRCEASTFHRGLSNDRGLYWPEVRDQLNAADDVLAIDYLQAQRFRAWLRDRMITAFEGFDAMVMPTVPVLAPPIEDADDYLTILARNAILWSFVGFPAISVPVAPAPSGLPVGFQVVAAPHQEAAMLTVAGAVESAQSARTDQ